MSASFPDLRCRVTPPSRIALLVATVAALAAPATIADTSAPVAARHALNALSMPAGGGPAVRAASERFEVVALRDPQIVVRRLPLQRDRAAGPSGESTGDAPVGTGSMLMGLAALMAWITLRRVR